MADFDPVSKATEIDNIAYDCLKLPRHQEIERRECAQRLYQEVGALTQKQAVEVGKVFERYSGPNPPPHNISVGHEILFTSRTSPVVSGFKFTVAAGDLSGYLSLTAELSKEQLLPRLGLSDKK